MTTWVRSVQVQLDWLSGAVLIDSIAAGNSYLRVHVRWGFYGDSPVDVDMSEIGSNVMSFGLVTTIGNGTETPPNARTQAGDQAPPTQRWIYWETRAPVMTAISADANVVSWRDSGSSEPTDTKGQVLATGLAPGQTLNLWGSWAAALPWAESGNALLWWGTSVLHKD